MTDATCLFCRIVRGDIPAVRVAESERLLAFRDIAPQAPLHVLIIPKQHLGSLVETTDAALLGELVLMAADVARQEGISDAGYRAVINTGVDGGQSVSHLHVHVLGGRAMHWPPG